MIAKLLTGIARSLFLLACGFAAIAALALYGCYRCLRAAIRQEHGMPVRDATFALLGAALMFTNALREQAIKQQERTHADAPTAPLDQSPIRAPGDPRDGRSGETADGVGGSGGRDGEVEPAEHDVPSAGVDDV